jgi:uncharacterized damage-inducible protein DinB
MVELFSYNEHSNHQLALLLQRRGNILPEKIHLLFSHILNAHQIWNSRIQRDQRPFGTWEMRAVEDYVEMNRRNHLHSRQIREQFPDMDTIIRYTNTRGDEFSNSVKDILFHIVNHSTYHRGQIAMLLRENGETPLASDYIAYRRQQG